MANIEKVIGGMKNISFINVDIVAYVRQAIISVIARFIVISIWLSGFLRRTKITIPTMCKIAAKTESEIKMILLGVMLMDEVSVVVVVAFIFYCKV